MSLLNLASDGLPNVLVVLHAAVLRMGQRGISEAKLLEAVAPVEIVSDDSVDGDRVRKTLRSWIEMGLFIRDGTQIFANAYPEGVRTANAAMLRDFTRRASTKAALSASVTADIWGKAGAADLTRTLAWMLTQNVYDTDFSELLALEGKQLITAEREFMRNDSRLSGLKQWARFLGFSREPFADIDPTVALRDALTEIIAPGQSMSADAFLERVATVLPVLDRGEWQVEVLNNISPEPGYVRTSGVVSTALSRALLSLRASRELVLRQRSDSGSFMVLSGSQGPRPDLTFHEVECSPGK